MKFVRLDLTAYGPFTRRSLDFSAQGPDLHIVYGPNEAGKSTALRAISGLLYGIEMQTGDAHLHAMSELRIGATLRHSSGVERSFVRKKGRQGTLLDAKGNAIDEAHLRAWLSVADRDQYAQMFGLSHDQLREAGAALADAKTDVGRMLFGASLDGTTLHQTLTRLDAEAERLLSSGGNAGTITKALVAYRTHHARARDLALPAKDFLKVEQEMAQADEETARLREEMVRLETQRHRLERVKRTLPWTRQRDDARRALTEMGDARLPADLEARRSDALHAIELAEAKHRHAETEASRAQRELDALEVSDALLAAETRLQQLRDDLGKYKSEQRDRPGVMKEIVAYRSEQRELLGQMGRADVDPRHMASIRVDDATRERIDVLRRQDDKWQTTLQGLRESLATKRSQVEANAAKLQAIEGPSDVSMLRAVWEHLRPDRALPQAIAAGEAQVVRHEAAVKIACERLAPWRGSPDTAATLQAPAEDAVRRFEAEFDELGRVGRDLARRRQTCAHEFEGTRARLQAAAADGEPPSEVQLAEARARRDLGWERVRLAWSSGAAPGTIDDDYAAGVPLVAAYTAAARVADELVDALRRESSRAAEIASLRRAEAEKLAQLASLDDEVARHSERERGRRDAWSSLWASCGFDPSAPREMLAWLERLASLQACLRERDNAVAEVVAKRRSMAEQGEALRASLAQVGVTVAPETPWLPLLLLVEQTLERALAVSRQRAQLDGAVADGRQELAELQARLDTHHSARDAWQAQWASAVAHLGLRPDALPEEAAVVTEKLSNLFRLEEKCSRQEARLKAIDKQMQSFEETVAALVADLAPDLTGNAVERAETLLARRDATLGAAAKRATLEGQLASHARDLEDAAEALEGMRRQFRALLEEVSAADDVALRQLVERAAETRRLVGLVEEAERHLAQEGEGWSVDALAHEAEATDSDRVAAALAELEEERKSVEARQREQAEAIGALRERRSRYTGAEDAATALAEAHEHLAQATLHADRYARVRLATVLLRRGIESYRQKNETSVLRRAGRLFECLTLGRYQNLRVVYEGERARLVCMRGNEEVDVKDALSDGTLDQLYLSLRFASLEQHLDAQEPMPLVLDDIFIHFDDDRTAAGLRVLAEFARRTQVLLLTHHARNLDLARRTLDPDAWVEHRLDPPSGLASVPIGS